MINKKKGMYDCYAIVWWIMIPKVIHYCWFGGKKMPWDARKCISSWKKYCPDYEIIQWDESNFNIECHDFVKDAYAAKQWAFVSDYARLKIMYENGGIYLDTDVELLKSLDSLLCNECYIGIAQNGNISTGLGFGAVRHHETVLMMLKQYDGLSFDIENRITCPMLNTSLFYQNGYIYEDKHQVVLNVNLFPAKYFDPIAAGSSTNLLCDESFSIHNYSASWCGGSRRLKRKIIMFLGAQRVNRIKRILRFKNR